MPFDCLDQDVALLLFQRFGKACEALFDFMSLEYPKCLSRIIRDGNLDFTDLTFAAESMGNSSDSQLVRRTLTILLFHPKAVVREGAIYGLQNHLDEKTRESLAEALQVESNEYVRRCLHEALAG
jgi:hypothetical protein